MKLKEEENKIQSDTIPLGIIFITLGLEGSMANEAVFKLKNELDKEIRQAIIEEQSNSRIRRIKKVYFSKIDALLDNSTIGPQWLRKYDLAKLIIGELEILNEQTLKLICYTIMPNHIHLVFEPKNKQGEAEIVETIEHFKMKTRIRANEILRTEGEFWIHDHDVHRIHDQTELINIISYILENPVKAGLVDYWRDWPWSYCNPEYL